SFVWLADEFYLRAGLPLPNYEDYEEFYQLENGVGMMSLFKKEVEDALVGANCVCPKPATIVTGIAAARFMQGIANKLNEVGANVSIAPIPNIFFGETVTVAGLVTGSCIVEALRDKIEPDATILIPQNMLIADGDMFLDNMTVRELAKTLNINIKIVPVDGAALVGAILAHSTTCKEVQPCPNQ
ncbi:MAG: DUF512 domain-containing protein, partial [Defluviitaleaceae bacterium]|nr:DUF512 domain-containing protein [Defluviitaleaceae bacterium]